MQFRFTALRKMRAPDELDTTILLARPRAWIATLVVLIVVAGAGVWAFLGQRKGVRVKLEEVACFLIVALAEEIGFADGGV